MIIRGMTRDQIRIAAGAACVGVEISTLNRKGTRHRVKVNSLPPETAYTASGRRKTGAAGDAPYQRISPSLHNHGRRVHAVCWHGFRDFFRLCFMIAPDAVMATAMDTWRGSADFENRYRESGRRNVGSMIAPVAACEACRCEDAGLAN